MITEYLQRIYPIGTMVAYKRQIGTKPLYAYDLGIVIGYTKDGHHIRVQNVEFPEFEYCVPRNWIRAYYTREAMIADTPNRIFL